MTEELHEQPSFSSEGSALRKTSAPTPTFWNRSLIGRNDSGIVITPLNIVTTYASLLFVVWVCHLLLSGIGWTSSESTIVNNVTLLLTMLWFPIQLPFVAIRFHLSPVFETVVSVLQFGWYTTHNAYQHAFFQLETRYAGLCDVVNRVLWASINLIPLLLSSILQWILYVIGSVLGWLLVGIGWFLDAIVLTKDVLGKQEVQRGAFRVAWLGMNIYCTRAILLVKTEGENKLKGISVLMLTFLWAAWLYSTFQYVKTNMMI